MRTVALGEVALVNPRGETVSAESSISFVGMAELDAGRGVALPLETRRFVEVSKGYTLFRNHDVLAAKITPCWENGKVGQAQLDHSVGVGSTEFHVLRPGGNLDDRFLLHFLRQTWVRRAGEARMTGSAGQKRVPASFLTELQIPLPPLPEQRRIAAILDHADALRVKRRQVLAHLDALTQSIFHDMFGDPDRASDRILFGSVANLAGGRSIVADDSMSGSEYRVLKISAVTSGQFKPWESKPLPEGYVPPASHLVRTGDLLMSRANTAELVGAVAHVTSATSQLALPDKIWRFEWKIEAEPTFWHALLSTPEIRRRISRLSSGTGGSMKNVAKSKLDAMTVPRVALRRQQEFAERAQRVAHARTKVASTLAADDELFASLQSRAFDGRL